jgi:hypothetical protein
MFFNSSSEAPCYKLAGQMMSHTDSVHSVAMTKGGNILASSGELSMHSIPSKIMCADYCEGSDGVCLWDIKAQTQLPTPNQHHVQHGQVSCVLWVTCHPDTKTLRYGTGLGYCLDILCFGDRRNGSVAFDSVSTLPNTT